jgi:hypothetical protein
MRVAAYGHWRHLDRTQRKLTAQITDQSEWKVVCFRHSDALLSSCGGLGTVPADFEANFAGSPIGRRISGSILVFLPDNLTPLIGVSLRFDFSSYRFAAQVKKIF